MTRGVLACTLCVVIQGVLPGAGVRAQQEPSQPQAVSEVILEALQAVAKPVAGVGARK